LNFSRKIEEVVKALFSRFWIQSNLVAQSKSETFDLECKFVFKKYSYFDYSKSWIAQFTSLSKFGKHEVLKVKEWIVLKRELILKTFFYIFLSLSLFFVLKNMSNNLIVFSLLNIIV
jgi:hypothetical protein